MPTYPPYIKIINKNILHNPAWLAFLRGEGTIPGSLRFAANATTMLYYVGDYDHARMVSVRGSTYYEQDYRGMSEGLPGLYSLFRAALFRSLAGQAQHAHTLWDELVMERRKLDDAMLLQSQHAHYWVYEAYALTKLERFGEVNEPARKGFDGIVVGKGLHRAPHRNSLEYGLPAVLQALAAYKLSPSDERRKRLQQAFVVYKKENVRYGKVGYPVIFDLQVSCADVLSPVLPGPDPSKD